MGNAGSCPPSGDEVIGVAPEVWDPVSEFGGAGSITAAQFIKRFVGDVDWAHLDIAGVTWSKRGTDFSRPGGTGFGVRLLNNFVKENYE